MSASNENDQPTLTIVSATEPARGLVPSELIDEPTLASRLGGSRSTLQSWRGPRFIKLGRMVRGTPTTLIRERWAPRVLLSAQRL